MELVVLNVTMDDVYHHSLYCEYEHESGKDRPIRLEEAAKRPGVTL